MPRETTVEVCVRYSECDPMGVAHHSVYPVWFEIARTELLRKVAVAYRDLEAEGVFFVVARLNIRYRRPARYDDVLTVRARELSNPESRRVKIEHAYEVARLDTGPGGRGELLATGTTILACVDGAGRVRAVPEAVLRGSGR